MTGGRRRGVIGRLGRVTLFAVAYLACAAVSRLLSPPASAGVTVRLASGLFVAGLLVNRRQRWPLYAAAAVGADFVYELWSGEAEGGAALRAFGNGLEALVGAGLARMLLGPLPQLSSTAGVVRFTLAAALAGPTLGATVGATVAGLESDAAAWHVVFLVCWAGRALGVLLVAPIVLASFTQGFRLKLRPDLTATAVSGTVTVACALGLFEAGRWTGLPLDCLALPLVLWAAVRHGQRAAAGAALAIVVVGAAHVRFWAVGGWETVVSRQLLWATLAWAGAFTAAAFGERRHGGARAARAA